MAERNFKKESTALLIVDPYNHFISVDALRNSSEKGKKEVWCEITGPSTFQRARKAETATH